MRLIIICTIIFGGMLFSTVPGKAQHPTTREAVQGKACYSFGDDETPTLAKRKAEALARERAVSGYRVWVESSSKVENFQLKEDLIQTISAGMLHKVVIDEETSNGREICIALSAEIDPQDIDMEVSRRQDFHLMKNEITSVSFNADEAFGLRVWLNKEDGRYLEDDALIIHVQSDQDAYLKLDYFQANGTVVHLVPNFYRKQARIKKGEIYTFGKEGGPERFRIGEPFGDEVIKAVASVRPFDDALTSTEDVSNSEAYMQTLKKGLSDQSTDFKGTERGIKVMSGASVALYTSSRKVMDFKKTLEK